MLMSCFNQMATLYFNLAVLYRVINHRAQVEFNCFPQIFLSLLDRSTLRCHAKLRHPGDIFGAGVLRVAAVHGVESSLTHWGFC